MIPREAFRRTALKYAFVATLLFGMTVAALAQGPYAAVKLPQLSVALLSDASDEQLQGLDSLIAAELSVLLDPRFELTTTLYPTGQSADRINDAAARAYATNDIVVATGLVTSQYIANQTAFAKPTIAAVVLGELLPASDREAESGSGIDNFTWISTPFDIGRDLETLAEIKPFEQLSVLIGGTLGSSREAVRDYIASQTSAQVTLVDVSADAGETLNRLDPNTDAVYAFPLANEIGFAETQTLYRQLAERGLVVFSLIDQPDLDLGAYAAYAAGDDIAKLPRRVALDVLKLTDGRDASELSTALTPSVGRLIINMEAARISEVYPSFELLSGSAVVNLSATPGSDTLSLEAAIIDGLAANLGYKSAGLDVVLAGASAGLAKANLLPQLSIGSAFTTIDGATAANSFGQQGLYNWTAQASVTQVVLSEPAFANLTVQRLLLEAQKADYATSSLDLVLEITNAYVGMLQARAQADLRNQNLVQTRANYALAQQRSSIGVGGQTDVFRWESELALGQIQVNDALAQFDAARYNLNQLLNRDIEREYVLPASVGADTLAQLVSATILPLVENAADIDALGDFLVAEAYETLPALRQIELSIQASERQALSRKRANYIPTLNLRGQYDYNIGNYKTTALPAEFGDLGLGNVNNARYTVGLNLSFPILTGGARRLETERAEVQVMQARLQELDLRNKLETRLRTDLANSVAAYRNVEQARRAATSSRANYEIIRDLYRQGSTNATSLVDAQNVALQSDVNARTIAYQFVADFIALERSTGSYQFLASPEEQADFVTRFQAYLVTR